MLLWVGRGAPSEWLQNVLQTATIDGVECSRLRVVDLPNDDNLRVKRLIHAIRSQHPHLSQVVRVVAPKDPLEPRFLSMLTEDRAQMSMSYIEFLCHVHRQIQQKFAS